MDTMNVNLPMFPGFYYSWLNQEIDSLVEREAEYMADERQAEDGIPEHLRLDASEFGEILFDCSSFGAMHRAIAEVWVDALNQTIGEVCAIDLGMKFEELTSPREYNFSTDRVFVDIPADKVRAMFEHLKGDGFKDLKKTLEDRHTSRSGFHSFYSNDLEEWLEKPLEEWDHNELGSLICAYLAPHWEEIDKQLLYAVLENDGLYSEWSDNVDWKKFDEKVAELREEKAEQWREENPDMPEPPYRCTETLELPL